MNNFSPVCTGSGTGTGTNTLTLVQTFLVVSKTSKPILWQSQVKKTWNNCFSFQNQFWLNFFPTISVWDSKPFHLCFVQHSAANYHSWPRISHSIILNTSKIFCLPWHMHNLSFCLQYIPTKLIIWIPKLELCWKRKKKNNIKDCKNYDSSKYLKALIICSSPII